MKKFAILMSVVLVLGVIGCASQDSSDAQELGLDMALKTAANEMSARKRIVYLKWRRIF
jgi:hypothetical protein